MTLGTMRFAIATFFAGFLERERLDAGWYR